MVMAIQKEYILIKKKNDKSSFIHSFIFDLSIYLQSVLINRAVITNYLINGIIISFHLISVYLFVPLLHLIVFFDFAPQANVKPISIDQDQTRRSAYQKLTNKIGIMYIVLLPKLRKKFAFSFHKPWKVFISVLDGFCSLVLQII